MKLRAMTALLLAVVTWGPSFAGEAEVSAIPSRSEVPVGGTVTVIVRIKGAVGVGSVPFGLAYDPSILEFVPSSSEEGSFLSSDGTSTSFLAVSSSRPEGGTAVVVGLSRLRPDTGATGRGVLCRLTFRARAPGVAALSFVRASVLDAGTRPLGSVFKGSFVTVKAAR
jgi:general secretion pathway protein D